LLSFPIKKLEIGNAEIRFPNNSLKPTGSAVYSIPKSAWVAEGQWPAA